PHTTPTAQIYTLPLHDALPICEKSQAGDRHRAQRGRSIEIRVKSDQCEEPKANQSQRAERPYREDRRRRPRGPQERAALGGSQKDRKSTRLNSSHSQISYAVFC